MEYPILTKNEAFDSIYGVKESGFEQEYCKTIQKLIQSRPFGDHKFYIYSFMKLVCDITGVKKLYHFARLTKPDPIPGTTLLRANPDYPEEVTVLWSLPNEEAFNMYKIGRMFTDPFVHDCIMKYLEDPRQLMKKEPDDLTEQQIREIYEAKALKGKSN